MIDDVEPASASDVPGPVLVTGAAGHIGSSLVHRLVGGGIEVRALDLPGRRHPFLADLDVAWHEADVRDAGAVRRAARGTGAIVHSAGPISHDRRDARRLASIHVDGTRSVLEAAGAAEVSRLVHVSSIAACGLPTSPVSEDDPPGEHGFHLGYNRAKRRSEDLVLEAAASGLPASVVRPGLVLGPGDLHRNLGRLFTWGVRWPSGIRPPAPPGRTAVVSVDDLTDLLLRTLEVGRGGSIYHAVRERLPFHRLVQFIIEAVGNRRRCKPRVLPPSTATPLVALAALLEGGLGLRGIGSDWVEVAYADRVFEAKRTRSELGWAPGVTASRAVKRAARWYREEGLI